MLMRTFQEPQIGKGMLNIIKMELELTESEWLELLEALATKARIVRDGAFGDFDPLDGFDPEEWASQLEALYQKLTDLMEKHDTEGGANGG